MTQKIVIAIDLGASSGRVMQAAFDGERLHLSEIHRFANDPVQIRSTLHWDTLYHWREIQTGLAALPAHTASIGVDTWSQDFALLDKHGDMLTNPVHYRDQRTAAMPEWVFERVPRREVYERTGIQFMPQNTILQLASLVASDSPLLKIAHSFLMIPDLIHYWMTGEKVCEFTNATTTQFFNPHLDQWDADMLARLSIPSGILPPVVPAGTQVGIYNGIPVIAPATHDTGSAVVAVPMTTPKAAYISSGTWSLLGLELDHPLITDETYAANLTNEGGAYHTFRFLKNVMGLWLEQQCQATWHRQGEHYDYAQLEELARTVMPFQTWVDPDYPAFFPPGDMPGRIQAYCEQTGQPIPQTPAQIARCVYESLALKYRFVLERLTRIAGIEVERLHIVGGGSRHQLLCQMTANGIGREVVAGPVEATALGNAIVQLIALGELGSMAQARDMLAQSAPLTTYQPENTAVWDEAYQRFVRLISG